MNLDLPQNSSAEPYWEHAFQPRVRALDALFERSRGASVPHDSIVLVEGELRALQAQLAPFYRRVNSFRPVSRLSTELLLRVFHYLSILEPTVPVEPERLDNRQARHDLAPIRTWIKVTHVCSAFRECALGDRSLWTATTTAFGKEWMSLLVKRAQIPPRSVHVGVGAPGLLALRALLRSAHDVQITHLNSGDSLRKSSIALPEVRSLRIHVKDSSTSPFDNFPSPLSKWSTYQPVKAMPCLAKLHIYGVNDFDLKNPHITGRLTSLYIGSRKNSPLRHKIKDVFAVLAGLPLLTSFTLTQCYLSGEINERVIPVPALQYLSLETDHLKDIVHILFGLEFSAGIRIHIAADDPAIEGGSVAVVWDALRNALFQQVWADLHTMELLSLESEAENKAMRRLPVDPEDEDSFVVSAWRDDEPGYLCITGQPTGERRLHLKLGTTQEWRPEPDFCLQLKNYCDSSGKNGTLSNVVTLFRAASELRTLSLRPDASDSKIPWAKVFARYPHLSAVRIDNEKQLDHLFGALYFLEHPRVPVCDLRTISYIPRQRDSDHHSSHFWCYVVEWRWKDMRKATRTRDARGSLLASLIQQRAAAGAPLENIYIPRPQLLNKGLWKSLSNGSKGLPGEFMRAQQVFKAVERWNWEDWGRGV